MRSNPLTRPSKVRRIAWLALPVALLVAVTTQGAAAVPEARTGPTANDRLQQSAVPTDASGRVQIKNTGQPYLDSRLPVRQRVEDLLRRMTLEEKVGQMTQAERGAVTNDPTLITTWRLGSLLSGGGSVPSPNTPEAWADMVDRFQSYALQTRLQIPLLYGVDSVHGHGNLSGATVFPHNIGLGSTRDPKLVEQVYHVVAEETRATGPQWAFAPCLCVARDTRWGRTYESFSEDPRLVTRLATAIDGLQGEHGRDLSDNDRVLASAKHFAGDGDTEYGSAVGDYKIDQGVTVTNRRDFARIDLAPFAGAVRRHDTGTVMPSFSSIDWTEDGVGNPIKMHANRELITGVLKEKLGFDGFVISDWEAIHQLPGDWATQVRTGVNAGTDMFMEPFQYQQFETTLLDEVRAGRVSQARIDDAVRRILTKKFELGLFEHPYTDRTHLSEVGSPQHRALARKAVAASQVLLKNSGGLLPLKKNAKVYVAGRNADDLGNQAGGWTLSWQGASGRHRLPGNTILEGIRQVAPGAQVTYSKDGSAPTAGSEVGVVVIGETPYAEGFGDVGGPQWAWDPEDAGVPREAKSLDLQPGDKAVIDRVCGAITKCVVLVVSGRPQVIPPAQLDKIDALVASWLPGSQGEGVADVVFGRQPFTGKLSHSWPRTAAQEPINVGDPGYDPLYPFGWGLRTRAN
jgi:beta-glucosidase